MKYAQFLLALTMFSAGSVWAKDAKETKDVSKDVVLFEKVVVTFDKNSDRVPAEQMEQLKSAVRNARARGDIKKVELAVWSDKDHPMKEDLPKGDRDLADRRITSIKRVIDPELGTFNFISTYNMAEQANFVGRMFHSSEAELDSAYAKQEALPVDRRDLRIIKQEGAPSKAVMILKVEPKRK